ncbi:hypothetical protein GTY81_17100 [Streptomyces sp. SID8366]|uniref:hypothetical protein n=1 Tax=unclassified Streptomyces TaxID=2593676 RepID=UPI0013712EE9|nr:MULTISPECIES: hypothetical protein [unclassified Streptomyces]MYU05574.1 hypothetical protein [Streptomyces sp. SID8366]MYU65927.1 hypothetical protein [Streptomyces sp. SID69]
MTGPVQAWRRWSAGDGLLAQLLQPRRHQVLRGALPVFVGGFRRGGDGVRAVPVPAPCLLGPVRLAGLRVGFLGPPEPPERAGAVLWRRRLNGLERGEGEHGGRPGRVRVDLAGLHHRHELGLRPRDVDRQRGPDMVGDCGDVSLVGQVGCPGRGGQPGLQNRRFGPAYSSSPALWSVLMRLAMSKTPPPSSNWASAHTTVWVPGRRDDAAGSTAAAGAGAAGASAAGARTGRSR